MFHTEKTGHWFPKSLVTNKHLFSGFSFIWNKGLGIIIMTSLTTKFYHAVFRNNQYLFADNSSPSSLVFCIFIDSSCSKCDIIFTSLNGFSWTMFSESPYENLASNQGLWLEHYALRLWPPHHDVGWFKFTLFSLRAGDMLPLYLEECL